MRYLVTPAGFLRASAGPDVRMTSGWETCQSDFDTLARVAEAIALNSLWSVLGIARVHVSYLVVGVDVSVVRGRCRRWGNAEIPPMEETCRR